MIQPESKTTPVPDAFIDDYLPAAKNPVFVLVYILAYRYFSVGLELSVKEAAAKLGISETDVADAWKYWAECGIVEIVDFSPESFAYEFKDVQKKRKKRAAKAETPKTTRTTGVQLTLEPEAKPSYLTQERPPDYTPDEMERLKQADEELCRLFKIAERLFAKPLTYSEMNALLAYYDWLKLPVEVIEVMLDYCVSNNKKGMRYIEKVAMDWADNGISTALEAEDYIQLFANDYRQIMRAFGHTRRDPNPKETAYMKKWLREFNMPLELVTAACDKTILTIGQPKFAYADAILTSWHEAEINTLDEAKALDDDFYNNVTIKAAKGGQTAKRAAKNKFNNFEGHQRDYDKIFEMEQQLITKMLSKK